MKKRMISFLALLLAVILPFTAMAATPTVSNKNPLSFSTKTLYGESISSDSFNKYDLIMVNYWAEWCGPCVGELPALEKIHSKYQNVLVLGVYIDDQTKAAITTAENAGVTYPLFELTNDLYNLYAYLERDGYSFIIPQTCFFTRDGYLLNSAYVGSRSYEAWASIVDELVSFAKTLPSVEKPSIKSQPKSVTAKAGEKVTFQVQAKGKNLKYQWYYRTSSTGKWKKVASKGTSATYTFKAKAGQHGFQFRCLVQNSGGKVYSKAAKLKIRK